MKTPVLTAFSMDISSPYMAAIVPASTSPEPADAMPELPLVLMKTRWSANPIREWAPLSTTTDPRSRAVR
jgi:hypothetical protein